MDYSKEINSLSAIDLWNHGTVELNSGSIPDKTSFCGQCWQKLKNETPGERVIDWMMFKEDIIELLNCLDYYKIDKKQEDYMFLQKKLIQCEIYEKSLIQEGKIYTDLELSALYLTPKGNRLEIPQGFVIGNYKALKAMMLNFEGKYNKNGFDFPYPAEQVLERISNQETTNLKKKFQFFGTPYALAKELCEMTFDRMSNKRVNILEPSAGQGAIIDAIYEFFDDKYINISLKEITAIEFMKENYMLLDKKYSSIHPKIKLLEMDFLKYEEYINHFDYVIANPPFTKGQDIEHFYKMYEACKPGGIVTSIMSTSWMHNSNKKHKEFREWLGIKIESWSDEINLKSAAKGFANYNSVRVSENGNDETVSVKTYEAGMFKESGTNVITCVVQVKKNDVSGLSFKTQKQESIQTKLF